MQGESAFVDLSDDHDTGHFGINSVIGNMPTAEFAAEVSEESERLLSLLPDESMLTRLWPRQPS